MHNVKNYHQLISQNDNVSILNNLKAIPESKNAHYCSLSLWYQSLDPIVFSFPKPSTFAYHSAETKVQRSQKEHQPSSQGTKTKPLPSATLKPHQVQTNILKYTQRLEVLGASCTVGLFMAAARHRTLSLATLMA